MRAKRPDSVILKALELCGGHRKKASKLLDMDYNAFLIRATRLEGPKKHSGVSDQQIIDAYKEHGGERKKVAEALGLSPDLVGQRAGRIEKREGLKLRRVRDSSINY